MDRIGEKNIFWPTTRVYMSETTPFYTDLTQKLNEVLESYFAQNYRDKCYLGLLLPQGRREMVQIEEKIVLKYKGIRMKSKK